MRTQSKPVSSATPEISSSRILAILLLISIILAIVITGSFVSKGNKEEKSHISITVKEGKLVYATSDQMALPEEISQFVFAPVQINVASKDKLMTVRGIGEKRADEILSLRGSRQFAVPKDLTLLSGIGDKKAEKLAKYFDFTKKDKK